MATSNSAAVPGVPPAPGPLVSLDQPSEYKYDVFFSYKRDPQSDPWHREVKDILEGRLRFELGGDVKIFIDTDDIRTGDRWKSKIRKALGSSKTLICFWSPLYFTSQWCMAEWRTFAERERRYKAELLCPLRYCDGDNFPEETKEWQILDVRKYTSPLPKFWDTADAVAFTQDLWKLAENLAIRIRNAPEFEQDFPIVEAEKIEIKPLPPIRCRI